MVILVRATASASNPPAEPAASVAVPGGSAGSARHRAPGPATAWPRPPFSMIAVAADEEDLVFSLVQLCASATGKPLTDDELRLIAGYPRQLALLFPGMT